MTRIASSLLVVVIAAGGGVAITTLAVAQTTPSQTTPAQPPMPPHRSGGHRMEGGHMMREVERLKTSLGLDSSQSALWDRAQAQMKPPADMREEEKARRDRIAAMLDDPAFDPRKLAATMDSAEAERHARMTTMRDAWFAVYASLNPVQRGQVREFLRSRLSARHGMDGRMHDRMGWRHDRHERHDRDSGTPSPSTSGR